MGSHRRRSSFLFWAAISALTACSNAVGTERSTPAGARSTGAPTATNGTVDWLVDAGVGAVDTAVLLDDTAAVRGIACGVALPVLCAAEQEKCCVRSLAVDICVDRDAACGCELSDCQVMEARCDGPEDCNAGESCCGTLTLDGASTTGYSGFACARQCRPEQNQRAACHKSGAACPAGLICAESQFLTNMHVCVDPDSLTQ